MTDDVSAFDAFFADEYASTVRLAHLLTGSNAVAEDLAQDAFERVHARFDRLTSPGGYLHTTTVNLCRSWHRRQRTARKHAPPADGVGDASLPLDAVEVLEAVRVLPYRQRAVLVLRYWSDLSEAQIAEVLGCRPGTVKSAHARALSRLREELAP